MPANHPRATLSGSLRRSLFSVAVLPLLAGALASCGYGSQAKPDEGARAKVAATGRKLSADTVRVGYFPNLTHATALVGFQEGLIEGELGGTRVSRQVFNAGPSEIEALNGGSLDIGFIGPLPSVNAYAKSAGRNLRIISGSASGGVKLVVNPEKVTSVSDLPGKRIATPQKGNTQDVAFLNWIAEQGWKVDPESGKGDVSVVRTDNKVVPAAYASGSVDGAWVPEPTASKLVSQGARVLLDEASLWPEKSFVITNLVVSQKFLAEHPDVVEAFLRGTVRTNDWINAHPERAKASANEALKDLTGKALPDSVIDRAWPSIKITDDPLAATLRTQAGYAVKTGLLEQPELAGIYDLKPLNTVLKAAGRTTVADAGLGTR
ncbi:aliphatic sulfonate ABC transporter substrate-binding protein [Streptomyces sp. NPDC006879]|uniref:aliphatic sulfonate ABC transporter substrate-binding protein n=1 Tax=Streptomyces sp. NPDC006879 TaxID=3364767 RepID=UPI00369ABA4F